ncbi:hypothetical protein DZF91_03055 [Actinomadura logoneensis]|uniref:Uncharacterized protein n=1 Tax=Actinomadura logoneensis TaxID=2293572 RepID=A0A372JST7_9ACTN|nr:hypothetical protein [Actinomadura logoneensis]RFU43095.1 hypothetical protein DZF91_03055 [Actinomadura logoneensis]
MRTLLLSSVLGAALAVAGPAAAFADSPSHPAGLPKEVYGGAWQSPHVQGIAVDERRGFMYFSFTDLLVKTDLSGRPVGSVVGFTGHLGDLDFNSEDGRVYGSLEYKEARSFYIAIFDVDKIDRMGMNAEDSDVVSTVYLKEVVDDYSADMNGDGVFDGNIGATPDHRYGCSGIDGVAFGPAFGRRGGPQRLSVAYGIYSNTGRSDNDYQVVLQYDTKRWKSYEKPLTQQAPHTSGPSRANGKYFVYTGNTTYGVQNLEYDPYDGTWLMAAYKGAKSGFPNYALFAVDATAKPRLQPLKGQATPEKGKVIPLSARGERDSATGVRGWSDSSGQYGLVAVGKGLYYVVESGKITEGGVAKQTARARLHRFTGATPNPFTRIS